ncbi:MAG: MCE family protein [Alphaproteobacteria bacterium]|nr:MCE family protein [Alphaproteobacteria bacterium]
MHRSVLETLIGAAVMVIAATFLVYGVLNARPAEGTGYVVTARFLQVGGLEAGSDVRINGIKVGRVLSRTLDPDKNFEAVIQLSLGNGVRVPKDSEAAIAGDGLLGDKYVRILPGDSPVSLKSGDTVMKTKNYKSLEDAVAEIIFLATGAN